MRVGFLFNHDQVHQVAHSLPIGLALLERNGPLRPVFAATTEAIAGEVRRLAADRGHPDLPVVRLGLRSAASRLLDRSLGGVLPARKLLVYRDNLPFFRELDALVVSERTSLVLRTRYRLDRLAIILADHGAGDRAIGFGEVTSRFDHVLAAGPKIRDRMVGEAGVDPARISITGYPKFDLARRITPALRFADPSLPTVLYNPHVSPHLSSWFAMGRQVLDFFVDRPEYNLIFAPHVMLFRRRWTLSIDRLRLARPGRLDPRHLEASNVHVDLGTRACTDMTYVDAADVYLGDASSQVYEFLRRPRPCVFLDAAGTDRSGDANYAHWRAGQVVRSVDELGPALAAAPRLHRDRHEAVQRELFDYTFDLTDEPSGVRGARRLGELLLRGGRPASPLSPPV